MNVEILKMLCLCRAHVEKHVMNMTRLGQTESLTSHSTIVASYNAIKVTYWDE